MTFGRKRVLDTILNLNAIQNNPFRSLNCSRMTHQVAGNFVIRGKDRKLKGFDNDKEKEWREPFHFICSSDCQFGMIEGYIVGKNDPKWDKEIELAKMAVAAANRMRPKPAFFIICGDMIDAMPGTKNREPQYRDFVKVFSEVDPEIPLVCVCGNHDVSDRPKPEHIAEYKSKFGDDYLSFACRGVLFIVLNSQLYKDPADAKEQAKEQDAWLEGVLKKVPEYKHAVVFQHIPWFLYQPDEKSQYFNIETDLRMRMLDKFYKAGIRYIFAGHYHRNAGGHYKDLELVVTSAIGGQLGDDKSGFRIVRVFDSKIDHKYYALEDIPKKISFD